MISDALTHASALADLEAGRPLQALRGWRGLLLAQREAVLAHLEAAEQALPRDVLAPLRRQALALAHGLLSQEPGEHECQQLGGLLRAWGELCLPEVPSRALQHFERAWCCGRDPGLNQHLATLYARLGYGTGARLLAVPPVPLEPWPLLPCAAQACNPCQHQDPPPDPGLGLLQLPWGRIWLQRHRNPWRHTHGLAVQDQAGAWQLSLCRHYPWPWPACPHQGLFAQGALLQLEAAAADVPPPVVVQAPVLAVAELSGEMYFHWQLELLPRLGRLWAQALEQWPNLRLWHNGGDHPYVQEGLQRLGITPDRLVQPCAHLQAELLLVPSFASAFGSPAQANLAWLEHFWGCSAPPLPPPRAASVGWLGRQGATRRPVLAEAHWSRLLHLAGGAQQPAGSVHEQLAWIQASGSFVAPHGAALANLIAARPGSRVLELVNPAYQPAYFSSVIHRRQLQHCRVSAAPTPLPLQEWLYEGPLAFPIDLRPGASEAAERLREWLKAR